VAVIALLLMLLLHLHRVNQTTVAATQTNQPIETYNLPESAAVEHRHRW